MSSSIFVHHTAKEITIFYRVNLPQLDLNCMIRCDVVKNGLDKYHFSTNIGWKAYDIQRTIVGA